MAVHDLLPEEASTEFLTNNQTWNKQASFEQLGYFYCVDTVGQGPFFNACESAQNMSSVVSPHSWLLTVSLHPVFYLLIYFLIIFNVFM